MWNELKGDFIITAIGGAGAKILAKNKKKKKQAKASKGGGGGGIVSAITGAVTGRKSKKGKFGGGRKRKSVNKMLQNLQLMNAIAGKNYTKTPAGQMALMKIGTKLF